MAQENVEFVQRAFAAYNVGDLGALRELYDPRVVWHHLEGWPEPGPSVGQDAVLREVGQLREAWQAGDRLELVGDLVDAGDRVLARAVWRGSGSGPDAAMEFTFSSRSARAESSPSRCTGTTTKPSEPWGSRSRSSSAEEPRPELRIPM
jgi:ketosteroid isomerase-like protein